jgi:hypothetical protein
MNEENNIQTTTTADTEKSAPVSYTEDQMREAYATGQKDGFATAIRKVRSEINDYLNDLLVTIAQ